MMTHTHKGGWLKPIVALFALVLGVVGLVASTSTLAHAEGEDYNFFSLSNALSAYTSNAISPSGEGVGQHFDSLARNGGTAGGMLGYPDQEGGALGWLSGALSSSSMEYEYSVFNQIVNENGDSVSSGFHSYMFYGAALNDLGIDKTAPSLNITFFRGVEAAAMFLFYVVYLGGSLTFNLVIGLLKMLNPGQFFYQAFESLYPELTRSMMGGAQDTNMNGFQQAISNMVYDIVRITHELGSLVLVVFVSVFILSLFLWRSSQRLSQLKRLLVRMCFLVLGAPMLLGLYTASLNALDHMSQDASDAGSVAVMETYMDFGSWARNTRLMPPSAFGGQCSDAVIEWDAKNHSVTELTASKLDKIAYCINYNSIGKGIDGAVQAVSVENLTPGTSLGDSASRNVSNELLVLGLLGGYTNGDALSGGQLESAFKGSLSSYSGKTDDGENTTAAWFNDFNTVEKLGKLGSKDDSSGDITSTDGENIATIAENPILNLPPNSGLMGTNNNGVWTFGVQGGTTACYGQGTNAVNTSGQMNPCTLSPLALYNFTNTSFDSEAMIVYSASRVASGAVRESHLEVVRVGSGLAGFIKWTNTAIELVGYGLIAFVLAFGMLFSSIRRFFQLVVSIPFGLLGVMGGIAKAIIYTLALIIELFGTLVAYGIMTTLFGWIVNLPRQILLAVTSDGGNAGLNVAAWVLSGLTVIKMPVLIPLLGLIGIILMLVYIWICIKTRKSLIRALNEGMSNMVNRFLGTGIAAPAAPGPSKLGRAVGGAGRLVTAGAGGLAAGAGKAMVSRMAGGAMPSGVGSASGLGPRVASFFGGAGGDDAGRGAEGKGPDLPQLPGGPGNPLALEENPKDLARRLEDHGGLSHGEELPAGGKATELEKPADGQGETAADRADEAKARSQKAGKEVAGKAVEAGAKLLAGNKVEGAIDALGAVAKAGQALGAKGEEGVEKVIEASGIENSAQAPAGEAPDAREGARSWTVGPDGQVDRAETQQAQGPEAQQAQGTSQAAASTPEAQTQDAQSQSMQVGQMPDAQQAQVGQTPETQGAQASAPEAQTQDVQSQQKATGQETQAALAGSAQSAQAEQATAPQVGAGSEGHQTPDTQTSGTPVGSAQAPEASSAQPDARAQVDAGQSGQTTQGAGDAQSAQNPVASVGSQALSAGHETADVAQKTGAVGATGAGVAGFAAGTVAGAAGAQAGAKGAEKVAGSLSAQAASKARDSQAGLPQTPTSQSPRGQQAQMTGQAQSQTLVGAQQARTAGASAGAQGAVAGAVAGKVAQAGSKQAGRTEGVKTQKTSQTSQKGGSGTSTQVGTTGRSQRQTPTGASANRAGTPQTQRAGSQTVAGLATATAGSRAGVTKGQAQRAGTVGQKGSRPGTVAGVATAVAGSRAGVTKGQTPRVSAQVPRPGTKATQAGQTRAAGSTPTPRSVFGKVAQSTKTAQVAGKARRAASAPMRGAGTPTIITVPQVKKAGATQQSTQKGLGQKKPQVTVQVKPQTKPHATQRRKARKGSTGQSPEVSAAAIKRGSAAPLARSRD